MCKCSKFTCLFYLKAIKAQSSLGLIVKTVNARFHWKTTITQYNFWHRFRNFQHICYVTVINNMGDINHQGSTQTESTHEGNIVKDICVYIILCQTYTLSNYKYKPLQNNLWNNLSLNVWMSLLWTRYQISVIASFLDNWSNLGNKPYIFYIS